MIDKLAFLTALAREKHFGRAATACGVTQPTLSAGIKQLETTLGVLLVQRSGKFGGFTLEGERVLEWARRMVADERAMRDEVRSLKQGLSGHLRLAVVPTALPVVARLTTPLRAAHPAVRFTIQSCSAHDILAMMENVEIDAGLLYVAPERPARVRSLPVYEERYCLLINRATALGARTEVSWAEIAAIPLCLLTSDMQNRHILDQRLQAAGGPAAPATPVLESNSLVVLLSHVCTGAWASVVPSLLVESLGVPDQVAAIPVAEREASPVIGLVYPNREPLLPLTAALRLEAQRLAQALGLA